MNMAAYLKLHNLTMNKIMILGLVVGLILGLYYLLWLDQPIIHARYRHRLPSELYFNGSTNQMGQSSLNAPLSHQRKLGEVFDTEMQSYEIKSCLSPDLQRHEMSTCRFFAIMMDAGSTGTRVHIFEFSHDVSNIAAPFKLEQEVYSQVTPGLSNYMSNAKKAAESIMPLIKKAKATVPKSQWKHTPISLKATAGLRLLSARQAEEIIYEVDQLLDGTGFLTNDESVSIMTGIDEGIFGWFTLNFLLDRLGALKQEPLNDLISTFINRSIWSQTFLQTAAALDLGGGSTQITFRPKLNSTLIRAPDEFIRQIKLVGRFIDLYTHSYLGNGLMAARLGSLQLANKNPDNNETATIDNRTQFETTCLPPSSSTHWTYNDIIYNTSGRSPYNFENCLSEQEQFTNKTILDYPSELPNRDIYVFGYFFDRAKQAGLVSGNGGYVSIADFASAGRKACVKRRLGKKDHEQWMCRDLSYIVALLRAYKLPSDKKLFLARRIRNMEVSWALGAAYHLLNSYHESRGKSQQQQQPLLANSDLPAKNVVVSSDKSGSSSTSCGCADALFSMSMSGGALKADWLNLTTFFMCTRLYYGLLALLPSAFLQLA